MTQPVPIAPAGSPYVVKSGRKRRKIAHKPLAEQTEARRARRARALDPNTSIDEMAELLIRSPRSALANPALPLMQFAEPSLVLAAIRAEFYVAKRDIALAGEAMTSRDRSRAVARAYMVLMTQQAAPPKRFLVSAQMIHDRLCAAEITPRPKSWWNAMMPWHRLNSGSRPPLRVLMPWLGDEDTWWSRVRRATLDMRAMGFCVSNATFIEGIDDVSTWLDNDLYMSRRARSTNRRPINDNDDPPPSIPRILAQRDAMRAILAAVRGEVVPRIAVSNEAHGF